MGWHCTPTVLVATHLLAHGAQVGSFPNWDTWGEWNGKYRDDLRRFLKVRVRGKRRNCELHATPDRPRAVGACVSFVRPWSKVAAEFAGKCLGRPLSKSAWKGRLRQASKVDRDAGWLAVLPGFLCTSQLGPNSS